MRLPLVAAGAVAAVFALPLGIVLLLTPASGACPVVAPHTAGAYSAADMSALWLASGGSTATTHVSGLGDVDDATIAGAVGMAESGGDPGIVNSIGAGGLMQIHPPEPDYLTPEVNMRMAVRKFNDSKLATGQGWLPWEAFTGPDARGDDGTWRGFLDGATFAIANTTASCGSLPDGTSSVTLADGTPWLADVPGSPGTRCDARIVADVEELVRRYHVRGGDCYAAGGPHAAAGEHPLGLGIDLVPGPAGSWDDVDRLARDVGWVRSCGASGVRPACPLKPWLRFVGYDGYPNHGSGNHLHLSWEHGPGSPASTVTVFSGGAA